jgi:hypothetical protein
MLNLIKLILITKCHYAESQAECHRVECHYAECHFAECRNAECRVPSLSQFRSILISFVNWGLQATSMKRSPRTDAGVFIISDIFSQTYGILMEDGEKWHEIRSKVQQDMMR